MNIPLRSRQALPLEPRLAAFYPSDQPDFSTRNCGCTNNGPWPGQLGTPFRLTNKP